MTEVERYEAEAATTRERMRSAMDEIQRRLNPSNILRTAKETVRNEGGAAVSRVGHAATANPVLLAAVGLAVALILYQRTRSDEESFVGRYDDDDEYAAYGEGDSYVGERNGAASRLGRGWTQVRSGVTSAGERLGSAGDAVRSRLDSARETVSHVASDASHRAGEGLRSAQHVAADAADRASHVARVAADRAAEAARAAARSGGELAESNPGLIVGVGVAAGVLLGLLTGERETEDSYAY